MEYVSTRGRARAVDSCRAILNGLAPDGGLYVPDTIPALDPGLLSSDLPYPALAEAILKPYLPEYGALVGKLTEQAYRVPQFDCDAIAPVRALCGDLYLLELWHGPTCAFKDMALQLMPRLLSHALKLTGETRKACILTATSGDTGKAALEGFRDVEQTKILVFYPEYGVSPLQKRQMATQEGANVAVQAINGNFDDAQSAVKAIFSDPALAAEIADHAFLSSANSINFGRLAPQIVYYVSAYRDLVARGAIRIGEKINVCVPTGNFGNIFACLLAKRMGLPVGKLICASNSNNVLTDFLETGAYDKNRAFHTTISPSMDILISSNLERLLYLSFGAAFTADCMAKLASVGRYTITQKEKALLNEDFFGVCCSEDETKDTIREVFINEHTLIDPHTAVGVFAARRYRERTHDLSPIVCASTASAYKFPQSVLEALSTPVPEDEFAALKALSEKTDTPIPKPLAELSGKPVRFSGAIEKTDLADRVKRFVCFA